MEIDVTVIGAALAVGIGALATGYAQAHIGSAAVAALVEKKELLVAMIVLVAIPETMVILGFVIAYLILQ
ncbi:MAG: ATPase [Nitrospinota bacterium]|nr:ATPase [Nitrospinota bacterium]